MYNDVPHGVFNIVFHPQVIGRGHMMLALERLIQHILSKGNGNIWLAKDGRCYPGV